MQALGELTVRLFDWVVRTSWQASILAILILSVQVIFRKKLSPGWRYGLWFLLLARLLMPVPPPYPPGPSCPGRSGRRAPRPG